VDYFCQPKQPVGRERAQSLNFRHSAGNKIALAGEGVRPSDVSASRR